jgi:hypothetical protein
MASLQTDNILDLVRAKLAEYLRDELGETLIRLETFRVYRKPYSVSTMLKAVTRKESHRFVAKQALLHASNASIVDCSKQAAVEYDVLCQLHPGFENVENCGVPRPVAVLPEANTFVMEFVDGYLLEEKLRYLRPFSSRVEFAQLSDNFYHCGRWLRHFHQFTGYREGGIQALDPVIKRCESRLEMIEKAGSPRCPKEFCRRAGEFVRDQVEALAGQQVLVSGRHPDFGPWNILGSQNGVTVLDFFGFGDAPLPDDILKMLVYLDAIRHNPACSSRRVAGLRERFLAGLGQLPAVPRPLAMICEAMQRITAVAGVVTATGGHVVRRWERARCLAAELEWFSGNGERRLLWPRVQ